MRWLAVLLMLALASPAAARELWAEDGFTLESAGWVDSDVFPDWIGIKIGLTLPTDGYTVFEGEGSLEFYLPCKGWVADIGIIIADGCEPNPNTGRDTRGFRTLVVTEDMGCSKSGGRVLMVARIPKLFPTGNCRPTKARWVGGYCRVEK